MTAKEYLNKGIEYYNNEDEDKAIVELTEALRLEPNLTEAKKYLALSYFYRGDLSYHKGDRNQAIDDFTKATEYNNTEPQFLGALAVALSEKEDFDKSIEAWSAFIEIDNTAVGYHNRAVDYYRKSKKYLLSGDKDNYHKCLELTIKDLKNCLTHNPDNERREIVQKQLKAINN